MKKLSFDVTQHCLVPKHVKLKDKEKKELLDQYRISVRDLPKIRINDSAILHLEPKIGDVIKVIRKSPTAGITEYYRGVINE